MWTNGDDQNHDTGDRVRLYQPIVYSSGRSFSQQDLTVSYIGGHNDNNDATISISTKRQCSQCHMAMSQLIQLHCQQRTYILWGCNKASCVNSLFAQGNRFACGGGGVFYGQSIQVDTTASATTTSPTTTQPPPTVPAAITTSDWTMDSDDDNDDDDDDDEDDLEQQVAAMELRQNGNNTNTKNNRSLQSHSKKKKNSNKKKKHSTPAATTEESSTTSLPCFELHSLLEPPAKNKPTCRYDDDDDDDDDDDNYLVGSSNSASDAKIQQMLARYMAEEEDVEILNALRGTTTTTNDNNSNKDDKKNQEKDERLTAIDRALLMFTDRMQRSPRQVLRHAPNGMPLWSL
jgi:hypothetical protein